MYAQFCLESYLICIRVCCEEEATTLTQFPLLSCACQPGSNGEDVLAQMIRILGRIEGGIQENLMCLKNLQGPNYPYPHLVVVKEIETQGKRGLLTKARGIAMKDMTLHFLCPVDMSKVPCGVDGEGYRFRETRGWVKKLSPVLQVRQKLLWRLFRR